MAMELQIYRTSQWRPRRWQRTEATGGTEPMAEAAAAVAKELTGRSEDGGGVYGASETVGRRRGEGCD